MTNAGAVTQRCSRARCAGLSLTAAVASYGGGLSRTSSRVMALVLLGSAFALAPVSAQAASLPAGSTAILSGAPSLFETLPAPVGEADLSSSAVSQDGRLIAFTSGSDGLVAGDDDRVSNIFVKDRATGSVTLASRADGAAGEPAHAGCHQASISDDGRRVAFTCVGALDPADTNGILDVYVRDIATATTVLVSRAGNLGDVGNQPSSQPSLSQTGAFVAFTSSATNLDPEAGAGPARVYRRTIGGSDLTFVMSRRSNTLGAVPVGGQDPSISDDGTRIAFASSDSTLDAADTNGQSDVYVRDHMVGTTVLASRAAGAGAVGNGPSGRPALAGDGSAVAFESNNRLDSANDPDTRRDIYSRQLNGAIANQNTALVSINAGGDKGQNSRQASIDDTGHVVGFLSGATQLHPDDTDPASDAYVKNLLTNALHLVSRADGTAGQAANANAFAVALSGDGTHAATVLARGITADADARQPSVIVREFLASPQRTVSVARPAGTAPFVNEGGDAGAPALSADARYAAFSTKAAGLGLPAGVAAGIVVRDRVTGSITLASRQDGPGGAPFTGAVFDPAISADGRRVAFTAAPTLDGDASQNDVWVRDLAAGRTFLASRADGQGGVQGNGSSFSAELDGDGSRVAFASRATNLGDGDTDLKFDVHVRDLDSDSTILASRADGPAGAKGNEGSGDADISADGTRVSFRSRATNLADGDTDLQSDAHLRDLVAGTTRLVSGTPAGVKSNSDTSSTSIDAAGVRVVFNASSTNLAGATTTGRKVFVRDFAANTLVLASRADGPDGAVPEGGSYDGEISPDGGYVAFGSDAGNLVTGAVDDTLRIYRRDLARGRTELVSRSDGATGAPSTKPGFAPAISAGGGCVGFSSDDVLVGAPTDFYKAYLRVFRADCAPTDATPADPPPSSGGAAAPAPSPGPGASPLAPGGQAEPLFPAKLQVKRARVIDGKLDVLVGITGRADGDLKVRYRAAGRTIAFTKAIGAPQTGQRNVAIRRTLTGRQRTLRTGIVEIDYAGNARTQPDAVRLRAARGRSLLRRTKLELDGRQLTVAGTLSSRVSGIVRLRVTYTDGAQPAAWDGRATIKEGKWSLTEQLPAAAATDPNTYLTAQFTGDRTTSAGPHRGEQFGKGL